jgi:hypothetical protein
MWESVLFLLQVVGAWVIMYWMMVSERAGDDSAGTGLLAIRPGGAVRKAARHFRGQRHPARDSHKDSRISPDRT